MSKLEELIQELCPNGVEYKKLGEIVEYQRGKTITKKNVIEGDIPVISGGQQPAYYHNESNREGKTITVAGSGYAGYIMYWEKPIFVSDAFSLKGDEINNNTKYIYYYLKKIQEKIYSLRKGAGISHVYFKDMQDFLVPVPPLEVQCEIVRILDKFTELTARRKQYEYYRRDLLSFGKYDNKIKFYNLGELCNKLKGIEITAGQMKKITSENGEVRIFAGGKTIVDVKNDFINKDDIIKVPNIIVQSRGIIDFIYYDKPCSFKREMWSYTNGNNITLKYIYYYLKNNVGYFRQRGSQMGSMPQISLEITEKYKIPIPSIYEQEKIVKILERFDKLCNDITSGIPAEIELNNKRYEYYRDKLLTFKEKK